MKQAGSGMVVGEKIELSLQVMTMVEIILLLSMIRLSWNISIENILCSKVECVEKDL